MSDITTIDRRYLDAYIDSMKEYGRTPGSKNAEVRCEKCGDSGIIMVFKEVDGYRMPFGVRCDCIQTRQQEKRFQQSGIPSAFEKKSFDNFLTEGDDGPRLAIFKKKAQDYVRDYYKHGPSLFISGMSGAGKTHLSIAICKALIEKGSNVYYMIYREAITKLKQVYFDEERYAEEIEPYKKVELLYIDDLFKGKPSEQELNIMYEIINHRYNNDLPVIISTELGIEAIRHLEAATAGRIDEMCHKDGAKNIVNFGKLPDRRNSNK